MTALARDRELERTITRELAGGLAVDVEPLILFAERRADRAQDEYGRDFPDLDRDLQREALEELADARNYLVWRLEAIHRGLCEGDVTHLQRAVKYVALAFEEIRAAS